MSRHPFVRNTALLGACFGAALLPALGQTNATALIAQVAKTFAPMQAVTSIKLSGSVVWHSGENLDSGPVTITVGSDGSQTLTAQLASAGERIESQASIDAGMACGWTRSGGVAHSSDSESCQKSVPWALPALALQTAKLPARAGYEDLGNAVVEGTSYRHLQGQLVLAGVPARLLAQSVAASTIDAYIDPRTLDLVSVRYQVHADDNPALTIQMEIRYGQITPVNGVRIPFLIQRYINGTLQLEITIASAQIS